MISQLITRTIIRILFIALLITLCGCATIVPTPPPVELSPINNDQDAKSLAPPPGKGRIYILSSDKIKEKYKKKAFYSFHNNQGINTDLNPETFVKWDLDPGAIVIYDATPQLWQPVMFDAFYLSEGQVLFFKWDVSLEDIDGVGWVCQIFKPISNEEGLARIQSLNMSLNKDSDKREYLDWSSSKSPVKEKDLGQGFYCRGNAYFQAHKFDEAIADYSRAMELNPKLSDLARLMRSLAYIYNGQTDKAESDFQQVIKRSPEMKITASYMRAMICDREGFFPEAIKYYQSFLESIQERGKHHVSKVLGFIGAVVLTGGSILATAPVLLPIANVAVGKDNKYVSILGLPGETTTNLEILRQQVEIRIKELQEITNKSQEVNQ